MSEKSCNIAYEPLIRALASQELHLLTCRLTPIPTYLDTIVYEIAGETNTFIFKSVDPRTRDPDGIGVEAWVLNYLQDQHIPVPRIICADTSKRSFPSPYFIMEKARGQPLSSLALKPDEKQFYFQHT